MSEGLTEALEQWRGLLGNSRVLPPDVAQERYGASTIELDSKQIGGALLPENEKEISLILKIAWQCEVPVYPISIGHNWGYGSATPPIEGAVILDLSNMKKITAPHADLGFITVEPGVTTGELEHFLTKHKIEFLPPLTGAGPSSSLIGNMLERGLSATMPVDRFSSLIGIEVVLPNGDVYKSPLIDPDKEISDAFYKWGVGPYIDGLFAQSNLGIVTRATFALSRKQEYTETFFIITKQNDAVGDIVDASREVLQRLPGIVPAIKIQGPGRTLTRLTEYKKEYAASGRAIHEHIARIYLRKNGLSEWIVFGSIQGPRSVVKAARRTVYDFYHPHSSRISFFSSNLSFWLRLLKKITPGWFQKHLAFMPMVISYLSSIEGNHSARNPILPFWKKIGGMSPLDRENFLNKNLNYDSDPECGFILFATVLPMQKTNINRFLTIAHEILAKFQIDPIINLLNFSDRTLFISCTILFNKSSPEETQRAHACYEMLAYRTKEAGAQIQRATAKHMHLVVKEDVEFWKVAKKIKEAIDSRDIISPGRYIPLLRKKEPRFPEVSSTSLGEKGVFFEKKNAQPKNELD